MPKKGREMFTVSFIGIGNRGGVYAKYFAKRDDVKIVAGCDICEPNVMMLNELYGVDKANLFTSEDEFFKEKRSDVLVISTLDGLHREQAVRAMALGYDVLLEKPIAPNLEDTQAIAAAAHKYGRDVVICHNLRYTPFYQRIKTMLVDGVIGDLMQIEQAENVAYHHFMLSFARGKWRKEAETSPIILQKCCHDLDIINWFVGEKCTSLTSFGSLDYYTKEHRPSYATDKCVDCPKTECAYNALVHHTKYPGSLCVPFGFDTSPENIKRYLSDDDNPYGKCIFNGDNDVCDRQVVNMVFANGVSANLLMHGFAAPRTDRTTRVYGSKGVIEGWLHEGKIRVTVFGQEPYDIDVNAEIIDESHLGGDAKLVYDYVDYKNGKERPLGLSYVDDSVYSHKLAFAAEESRVMGGKTLEV